MSKRLFNKFGCYNKNGEKCADEIKLAVQPILLKYYKKGFDISDLQNMMTDSGIFLLLMHYGMDKAEKQRRHKKK